MTEQVYQNLEAEWHDEFWALEGPSAELPLLRNFLSKQAGESLYIGSGSGRLLLPLLKDGHRITALEPSAEMRARCPVEYGLEVIPESWEKADLEKKFASILVPSFTLQLMERPGAALKKMANHLLPDAKIYLSLFFPWAELMGHFPQKKWYLDVEKILPDGSVARLETKHRLDENRCLLRRDHRYSHLDSLGKTLRTFETRQRIQWFTDVALQRLLKSAELKIEREINNFGAEMEEDEAVSVVTLILGRV